MTRHTFFTGFFFLIALVVVASAPLGYPQLRYFFKPFIMISLLAWSAFSDDLRFVARKRLFQFGMAFACLGDVLLMFSGFFLAGLVAFLVMQLLYITTFSREVRLSWADWSTRFKALLFLLVYTLLVSWLLPGLEDVVLSVAVPVYAAAITFMAFIASVRSREVSRRSFTLVLCGAVLFMVSDTLIAVNRVVSPVPNEHFWIMSTYMVAQFSIVKGLLKTA